MNELLMPRVYREYCWFALVLLILAIGMVGRWPLGEATPRAKAASVVSSASPPPSQPAP